MCVKFRLSSSNSCKIDGGPKFTLVGAASPARHLVEKFLYLEQVLGPI